MLYHNGFLDRPKEQIKPLGQNMGSMVYGLERKGAKLLAREIGISLEKNDWTKKNRNIKRIYLDHALYVSHFLVCLELAIRNYSEIKIIDPGINRISWKVKSKGRVSSVIPDKIFGLRFKNLPSSSNLVCYCLEVDRSTMPVMRTDLYQTSVYRKMLAYWDSWNTGLFQKYLGTKAIRVLFLTKSQERINSMIEANRKVCGGKGSRLFLFAQSKGFNLNDPDMVMDEVWQNGRDERLMSIIE